MSWQYNKTFIKYELMQLKDTHVVKIEMKIDTQENETKYRLLFKANLQQYREAEIRIEKSEAQQYHLQLNVI